MKNTIALIFIALSLILLSCDKVKYQNTIVVKDCTGTYLRLDGKDYHVCNPENLSVYADGSIVKASFTKLKEYNCSSKDAIVCMMYHENEGWIQVNKIK